MNFCAHGIDQKGPQAASSPNAYPWPSSVEIEASTSHQTGHVGAVGLTLQAPATRLTLYNLLLGAEASS